jgi:hypothetical protein
MKMLPVLACIPLLGGALSAQATPQATPQAMTRGLPPGGGEGLMVKLLPPSPQTNDPLRFVLNEKAYVAAFVVYPGAGVRLLYPTAGAPERLRRAGYNTDQLIGGRFDDDSYHVLLGPGISGPVYLYVIASRHPLGVARYVHRPISLARAVGEKASRSFYADVAFDALLNNAIALGDDQSWDADVYMLWPDDAGARGYAYGEMPAGIPGNYFTRLICADGSTSVVPINYPFSDCPGQLRLRPGPSLLLQAEQAASANSTRSAAGQRGALAAETVTVLPTIIGQRPTQAQRRAAIEEESASRRITYTTMANGDPPVTSRQAEAGQETQLQVGDIVHSGWREHNARSDRDALHGRYSPEHREQFMRQDLRRGQSAVIGRSPQLAPNPQLVPNPQLAPNPGMAPVPRVSPGRPR